MVEHTSVRAAREGSAGIFGMTGVGADAGFFFALGSALASAMGGFGAIAANCGGLAFWVT